MGLVHQKATVMMMFDPILLILTIGFMLVGLLVSSTLKSKFARYSQERMTSGLSGRQVAERMLEDNGIYDVKVISVAGQLTDHYNPADKTVNLSEDVYNGTHVAAAAVAAHECGHAVQHASAYQWLTMRSRLVPVVQVTSSAMSFLTIGLAFLAYFSPAMTNTLLLVFIICQAMIALFSLVTLPVEIDASRRALAWLDSSRITYGQEQADARDALKWAAYTYVVAALASVATLVYYIWRFTSNNRDN